MNAPEINLNLRENRAKFRDDGVKFRDDEVKFRDFGHIWEVVLQVLFYATPIIYALQIVPERLIKLVSVNPLAQIFQDLRSVMITPETLTTKQVFDSQLGRALPALIVLVVFVVGAWYFKKNSKYFAEQL